jgi:hypothetical protein
LPQFQTIRKRHLVNISANTFKAAARIAEEIESLQKQLDELLQDGPGYPPERITASRRKTPPVENLLPEPRERDKKGRGTLRPAVHGVLATSKTPLNAGAIYDALVASKYKFSFPEPRRILRIRLYKMAGIQPLGDGLFKLKGRL